jgi:Holliday junction resolvasome RuvABC ATP-dependent DNA helicase subunit
MSKYTALPFDIQYTDKIDLIKKVLEIYSVSVTSLTRRDMDILLLCLLYDMNDKKFKNKVISSGIGVNTEQNVATMLSRLKKKGLIDKNNRGKKVFNTDLSHLKSALDSEHNVAFIMKFNGI